MYPELELFIPILEILEIEVFNILYNPGNIEYWIFLFSHILEILDVGIFQVSHILEIRAAGGRLQGSGSGGLGLFLEHVPGKTSMVSLE